VSRIDELIREHCPNGVAFQPVGELADYVRGLTYSKTDEERGGSISVLRANNITLSSNRLNFDDVKTVKSSVRVRDDQRLRTNDILISAASGSKAHVGKVAFIDADLDYCFGGFMAVLRTTASVMPRFLFHLLIGRAFSDFLAETLDSTTINNLSASVMRRFNVPVPPLEVQREIVRILDNFTALEAELEAELEARRKQYSRYRNSLLSINQDRAIKTTSLSDIATFRRGTAITAKQTSLGEVPVVANGPVSTYSHGESNRTGETIVIARSGAYAGFVSFWDVPIFLTDAFSIHPDPKVFRTKYLFYWLQAQQESLHAMKKGAGVPHVRVKEIEAHEISVPSLADQDRIVEILDKFDAIVNDLSIGLPAELAARRRQYEYYRDKLLTFEESV